FMGAYPEFFWVQGGWGARGFGVILFWEDSHMIVRKVLIGALDYARQGSSEDVHGETFSGRESLMRKDGGLGRVRICFADCPLVRGGHSWCVAVVLLRRSCFEISSLCLIVFVASVPPFCFFLRGLSNVSWRFIDFTRFGNVFFATIASVRDGCYLLVRGRIWSTRLVTCDSRNLTDGCSIVLIASGYGCWSIDSHLAYLLMVICGVGEGTEVLFYIAWIYILMYCCVAVSLKLKSCSIL
ncbi:hypothetical protein Dimus_013313, partial [Dionaea muscipula]